MRSGSLGRAPHAAGSSSALFAPREETQGQAEGSHRWEGPDTPP